MATPLGFDDVDWLSKTQEARLRGKGGISWIQSTAGCSKEAAPLLCSMCCEGSMEMVVPDHKFAVELSG